MIFTPKTKISAYAGDEVTLVCQIESYPVVLYYWNKSNQMLVPSNLNSSSKYEIQYIKNTSVPYKGELQLKIRNLKPADFTSYICSVSNYLGKTMGTISLTELIRPSTPAIITVPSTVRYQPPPQTKPTRPINNKPIRPPIPSSFPEFDDSYEELNTIKPRRKSKDGQEVPKYGVNRDDEKDPNNLDNDLIPWPINTSSSTNLYLNHFFILILITLSILINLTETFLYV